MRGTDCLARLVKSLQFSEKDNFHPDVRGYSTILFMFTRVTRSRLSTCYYTVLSVTFNTATTVNT